MMLPFATRWIVLFCWLGARIERSAGFTVAPTTAASAPAGSRPGPAFSSRGGNRRLFASSIGDGDGDGIETSLGGGGEIVDDDDDDQEDEAEPTSAAPPSFETTSTVRIDDGGSNLTDRFKYKVHALMGDYDPPTEGAADDEDQDGNIMRALVDFPTRHVFEAVGKAADDADRKVYADRVRTVVFESTGDDDGLELEVVPRGSKFVKVRCSATVQSTAMINAIYEELGKIESTVMKF